jgi:hypothetical protein
MKKTFPIQNNAACLYKWTWSTIFLNRGTTTSCHRGFHWKFDETNIKDFHNHPGKLGDREKMKEGIWPGNGCEYCRDVEAAGGKSDRTSFVNDSVELIPFELENDPTATKVTPRLLEIYFSNVCNQSCIYCTPGFSSQIEQEVRQHGPSEHNWDYSYWVDDARDKYEIYKAKFWEWMEENSNDLVIIQTLGGEPMYQKEFDECLDFFDTHPNPGLTWRVFTNLNHPPAKFREKIERVQRLVDEQKIKRMDFVCSIDCWGPEVEYARYGLNLEEAEQNIMTLVENPTVGILFHATLTALTMPTLYQLIEKIIGWKENRELSFNWNTVVRPDCFNPYNFGHNLTPFIDRALAVLEKHGDRFDKEKTHLTGIKQQLLATPVNPESVNNLAGFLDDIDKRRNYKAGNWRELFPYIVNIIDDINKENKNV